VFGFCLLGILLSGLSNLGLPQGSNPVDRLDALEKARLAEVLQLRRTYGEQVWPGWAGAEIPIIVYNEQYAFLVGYPGAPPAGWYKVPRMEARGGPWEAVAGEDFQGSPYYRTAIEDPQKTPEAFTVLVGDRWVATFHTREYSQIAFYRDIREQLPPVISSLAPVRLFWWLLMGKTEAYVSAMEHESFHAFQGISLADQLAVAEQSVTVEGTYPFEVVESAWRQEMDTLLQAARANSVTRAAELARRFLELRSDRRESLNDAQVEYERLREWEEGLAKYAELEIGRLVGLDEDYSPVEGMSQDPSFQGYRGQVQFWSAQLNEAKNTLGVTGDTRFYYSGFAQAVVLDRLSPGWKTRALPGGEFLDDLLAEAVE
jgi:hypothetical protein